MKQNLIPDSCRFPIGSLMQIRMSEDWENVVLLNTEMREQHSDRGIYMQEMYIVLWQDSEVIGHIHIHEQNKEWWKLLYVNEN